MNLKNKVINNESSKKIPLKSKVTNKVRCQGFELNTCSIDEINKILEKFDGISIINVELTDSNIEDGIIIFYNT
jgi:hypothetical protein